MSEVGAENLDKKVTVGVWQKRHVLEGRTHKADGKACFPDTDAWLGGSEQLLCLPYSQDGNRTLI